MQHVTSSAPQAPFPGVAGRSAPRHHVRPAAGNWCNDPNGPLYHDGRYHLFFQHNPNSPVWGDIHWGHASSPDLVRWTDHGVALEPSPGLPDRFGAWSGCAVVEDGVPTAVYTGMNRHDGLGTVMLARAADPALSRFDALSRPVVDGPPPGLDLLAFRDPYVFTHEGRRWALLGAGHRGAGLRPDVLVYRIGAGVLDEPWEWAGSLLDADDPVTARHAMPAAAWECPALIPAGAGRWLLVLSLWIDDVTYTSTYLTGTLRASGGGLRFEPDGGGGLLDHGRDFYAPTALVERDRTLMWGWSWESRTEAESVAAGWAGCLSYPRELGLHPDGTLRHAFARELAALRGRELTPCGQLPPAYEIQVDLRVQRPDAEVTVHLGSGIDVRLNPTRGTLTLDRTGAPATATHPYRRAGTVTGTGRTGSRGRLRILVDGPLIEIIWDERVALTEKVYPAPRGQWAVAHSPTSADIEVTAWEHG
ncbi:glycoside hydrolase family 32 protein [Streptomyces sp. NPDC005480]|uniref:glycoside hydrolase family 32 protein n=1 Tax=Streptomyces sp. NPDC005480 TaxID=3154880 RepID=UPI0033A5EF5B